MCFCWKPCPFKRAKKQDGTWTQYSARCNFCNFYIPAQHAEWVNEQIEAGNHFMKQSYCLGKDNAKPKFINQLASPQGCATSVPIVRCSYNCQSCSLDAEGMFCTDEAGLSLMVEKGSWDNIDSSLFEKIFGKGNFLTFLIEECSRKPKKHTLAKLDEIVTKAIAAKKAPKKRIETDDEEEKANGSSKRKADKPKLDVKVKTMAKKESKKKAVVAPVVEESDSESDDENDVPIA